MQRVYYKIVTENPVNFMDKLWSGTSPLGCMSYRASSWDQDSTQPAEIPLCRTGTCFQHVTYFEDCINFELRIVLVM